MTTHFVAAYKLKLSRRDCSNGASQHMFYVDHPYKCLLLFLSGALDFCVTAVLSEAREIVGFAGSGPIFETENRFISQQEAKKSVHKTLYFSRFCNSQTDIVTCQNCSHLIIRCYLS